MRLFKEGARSRFSDRQRTTERLCGVGGPPHAPSPPPIGGNDLSNQGHRRPSGYM